MRRAIVFANGAIDRSVTDLLLPDDIILCADGGAGHALALGIKPHAVIGDFDSLNSETLTLLEGQNVPLHRFPVEKDETDLELTFKHALSLNPSEIILVCALGNRLDQMLVNILHLGHADYSQIPVSLLDGPVMARIIHPSQDLNIQATPGDFLSLIPIRPTVNGVTLTGVKWPLYNASLLMGSTLATSNILVDFTAKLSIGTGALLLVVPRLAKME